MKTDAKQKINLYQANTLEEASWKKFVLILERLTEVNVLTGEAGPNTPIPESLELHPGRVWVDLRWAEEEKIEFQPEWNRNGILLVVPEGQSLETSSWKICHNRLYPGRLGAAELARALQVSLKPAAYPGIAPLAEREAEIYFDKILDALEIGRKTDQILRMLGQKHPALLPQAYNIRQLAFSLFHLAYEAAGKASRTGPVVDLQLCLQPESVLLSLRFSGQEDLGEIWMNSLRAGKSQLLHQASLSADLIVLTGLEGTGQLEIKTLIASGRDFSPEKEASILARRISDFDSKGEFREKQRAARFLPLHSVPLREVEGNSPISRGTTGTGEEQNEQPKLNYQLKANMLERERNNLQGMVKKKTQLISSLQKDVNQAHRDFSAAKNQQSKELYKMRQETEKAKNECREAMEKLAALQRRMEAERENPKEASAEEEKPNFELEWKKADYARRTAEEKSEESRAKIEHLESHLQLSRQEVTSLRTELSDLKGKLLKMERMVSSQSQPERRPEDEASRDQSGNSMAAKMLESQKLLGEARSREQELTKEVKKLAHRVITLERTAKSGSEADKSSGMNEKQIEELKKQKTELLKKFDQAQEAFRKKMEEASNTEKALRKQIEELAAAGGGKKSAA